MNYADYEYAIAAIELFFAMLGMGATLTIAEFHAIARRPAGIAIVLVIQYLICPLWALALARIFHLTPGIALGLVILAAMPSGALSNIFAYLAKGNVPLSITATCASTLSCLIVTPLVLTFLVARHLPPDVRMPTLEILSQIIFLLLLPLALGMLVHAYWPRGRKQFAKWCIRICLFFLALLVFGSLAAGRIDIWEHGWRVPAVLLLFGFVLIGPIQLLCWLIGFNGNDAITIAIEITLRNCNVAILMKAMIFPAVAGVSDPIGGGVLYVALFYGGASLFLGSLPIVRRRVVERIRAARQGPRDALTGEPAGGSAQAGSDPLPRRQA